MVEVKFQQEHSQNILFFSGELDYSTVDDCFQKVQREVRGINQLILDFKGIQFIDSTGIGAILKICAKLVGQGINIMHLQLSDGMFQTMDILGMVDAGKRAICFKKLQVIYKLEN